MIIICKRPGQLGNSLFLFSHFIAYSLESNVSLMNLTFYEYADYFKSTKDSVLFRFPEKKGLISMHSLRKPAYYFFHFIGRVIDRLGLDNSVANCIHLNLNETFILHEEKNQKKLHSSFVFAQGWLFRCMPYLKKHQDFIRNYFHLIGQHQQNVDRVIAASRADCEVLIGLHIRHGDYARFEGGKYFYSLEQYYSIMLNVKEIFKGKKIRFLISSNGNNDYSTFKNMDVCFPSGHEVEDMYALAKCDYILGPPSTFSMWASFYGNMPLYWIKDPGLRFSEKDFSLPEKWM